jgi:hypothetical protein
MVNGTICNGSDQGSWEGKMAVCRACPVFRAHIPL